MFLSSLPDAPQPALCTAADARQDIEPLSGSASDTRRSTKSPPPFHDRTDSAIA